jgi:DNA-binding CsgD family transcriptional regulator
MRDRPPAEADAFAARAAASGCLANFIVDQRRFQLVFCHNTHEPDPAEVARFSLGNQTVAVVECHDPGSSADEARELIAKLTGRELQIAAMVAQGDATKHIAYKLRISEWTVGTYMQRIFAKLHVHNRAAMVYRCATLMRNMASAGSSDRDFGKPVRRTPQRQKAVAAERSLATS